MADKLKNKMGTLTEMSDLGTVEYTITKIIKASDEAFYTIGERKILFSCCATMKAGIDLKDFSAEDVKIDSDKEVTVTLPAPKVLAFNMPSEQVNLEVEEALVELEDQLIDLQAMTGADYLRDKVKDKKDFFSGLDKNMLKKIGKAAEVAGSIIPGTGATVLGKATGALFKGLAKSK